MLQHQWHLHLVIQVRSGDICCIQPRLLRWLLTSQCCPLRFQDTITLSILVSLPSMAEFLWLLGGTLAASLLTVSGGIPPAISLAPVALPFPAVVPATPMVIPAVVPMVVPAVVPVVVPVVAPAGVPTAPAMVPAAVPAAPVPITPYVAPLVASVGMKAELLKLDPMKDAEAFLDSLEQIHFYLRMPEFSTVYAGGSLTTDAGNLDASRAWEGQLRLAVKEGSLRLLIKNKGCQFHGCSFEMLDTLMQHC
jgi:hypothetical protein